jgi:hypothetical protein
LNFVIFQVVQQVPESFLIFEFSLEGLLPETIATGKVQNEVVLDQ